MVVALGVLCLGLEILIEAKSEDTVKSNSFNERSIQSIHYITNTLNFLSDLNLC